MGAISRTGSVMALSIAAALAFCSVSAVAVDRHRGDSWTYDLSTSVDVGSFVVEVAGTVTYEFEEKRTLTTDFIEYPTNVMSIDGELSGYMDLFGQPFLNASVTVGGFLYETVEGAGIAKEDNLIWTNATVGSGSVTVILRLQTEVMNTYSPPLLSGFKPSTTQLGDTWTETVSMSSVVTSWENGTMTDQSYANRTLDFDVVVSSSLESVTTLVGTFDAEKITSTDSDGNYEVYWWSDEVKNFVKQESFNVDSPQPYATKTLDFYHRGNSSDILLFAVGVVATVVAVIVLAIVITLIGSKSRRPPPDPHSITYAHEMDNVRSNR